eukprot:1142832-Pelagomonas_calceolata.AAC.3
MGGQGERWGRPDGAPFYPLRLQANACSNKLPNLREIGGSAAHYQRNRQSHAGADKGAPGHEPGEAQPEPCKLSQGPEQKRQHCLWEAPPG